MSNIEKNVMGAVRTIYLARQLTSMTALKVYVCAASLWGIGQLVWVAKVFENLSHVSAANSPQFFISAVVNTDLLVQAALFLGLLAAASLLLDLVRVRSFARFA